MVKLQIPGYDLGEVLGRGGVGVVYKALHLGLNRVVALKMLLAGAFAGRAERQRFAREAKVVAGLRHPNIVQVYDVGDLDGRPYFTMEFVAGGSLAELIAGTPRPARQAADLLAKLAYAIDAAHQGGIVHRDLKPSNVLLADDGTPKIGDFGLARHVDVGSSLTMTGVAVGTPSYMAPEQARGKSSEVGPAADLYALGAVLYELLTGRPPFRAESVAETLHQVIVLDPVAPSRLNTKVPRSLETICLKCLRKDPQLRYADAASLAEDLRRFLRGEAIAARPENWLQRLARKVRRRPAFSAAVAAFALVGASLLGGGLWLLYEREAARQAEKAEESEIERVADGDLREMVDWQKKAAWTEARAAMERAKGRLGHRGSADLRRRLDRGVLELTLVARLDAIRLGLATSVGGRMSDKRTVEQYFLAFKEAGLGEIGEAPEVVARQVRASNVKDDLVTAFDGGAILATDAKQKSWLADVARLADDDPTGWRDRARKAVREKTKTGLSELAEAAPVADRCVWLLIAVAQLMKTSDVDPVPLLTRAQLAHSGDFWINLELGNTLHARGNPGEALRYLQVAMTIRPGAGVVYNEIGSALREASRFDEAVDYYREAVRIDPEAGQGHHNLALTLQYLGKYDEALEQSRIAVRLRPDVALVHRALAHSLEAKGRYDEALDEYRRAITLDPKDRAARRGLPRVLIREGKADEARATWSEDLASKPPEHKDWYGYAELCLFLGLEDEYRRARRDLLDTFGASTDLYIAERTSRACLLLPASEDEMPRIIAIGERAWNYDRSRDPGVYSHFMFVRSLAEYRQGRLDRAISLMQGDASGALGPAPKLVLAMALHRNGCAEEALKTLSSATASHDWSLDRVYDQDDWIYHVLRREADAMIFTGRPSSPDGSGHP
jgi:eukaryotic-like serine/threonine-protein kinase